MAGSLAIRRAATVIRAGGVVAYPTEAVWGLGCNPLDAAAVTRVLELKNRPMSMGLVLIAADAGQFEGWIEPLPPEAEARLSASWPGPVTWVVPAQAWVPEWVHGGRGSLALRVTAHPQSAALCRAADMPIISTSANRSGRRPARSAAQVRRWFGGGVDFILGGATGGRERPSEIRDALTGRAVRSG
jgi:L-threonylcarbamoyladenylate synthase